MQSLISHLRYTLRLLLKSPGFTITAVVVLGLGIGINTAIFSLVNAVLLKPLPFPEPEQLVQIFVERPSSPKTPISYPTFLDFSRDQHTFQQLAVSIGDDLDLIGSGNPERVSACYATAGLFKVSRRPFLLGQPFTESDDNPSGPQVVVLSEHVWRNRFQSDMGVIGKNITLSGHSFQVIGVCPPQADDLNARLVDFFLPIHVAPLFGYQLNRRDLVIGYCVGRLKGGVKRDEALADLSRIHDNLNLQYPDNNMDGKGWEVGLISVLDFAVSSYSSTIWLIGAAGGCLLLVSIANIANLLVARAAERRREAAIRLALGAAPGDLMIGVLTEAIVLSIAGSGLGLAIGMFAVRMAKMMAPQQLYRLQDTNIDIAALFFVAGLTVIISALSGCLPAWLTSRIDPEVALKADGGRTGSGGPKRHNIQSVLIVGQCMLASLLLIGTALLVRSFQQIQDVPLGFNPEHLVTARVYPTTAKYADQPVAQRFFDQVFANVQRIPGIKIAAMNDNLPFVWDSGYFALPFHIHGQPPAEPGRDPMLVSQGISPGYFKTMEISLLRGRDFDTQDRPGGQDVMIIDQALAERFFPGQDPIGKQIDFKAPFDPLKTWTIVGIVANSLNNHPDNDRAIPVQAYFPYAQRATGQQYIILRTTSPLGDFVPEIRKAVASVDPDVVVTDDITLDQLIANKYAARRLGIFLFSAFSCAALSLAAVGIYGVLAYFVDQRSRDIGIRIAIGARLSNIFGLIVGRGLKMVLAGLLLGIVIALSVARFLEGVLYNVSPIDPIATGPAVAVLVLAGFLACLLPALRAVRINPSEALRD